MEEKWETSSFRFESRGVSTGCQAPTHRGITGARSEAKSDLPEFLQKLESHAAVAAFISVSESGGNLRGAVGWMVSVAGFARIAEQVPLPRTKAQQLLPAPIQVTVMTVHSIGLPFSTGRASGNTDNRTFLLRTQSRT